MGILHCTVLTSAQDPLKVGKGGLELYRCQQADGQLRWCFSLKQVEVVQYYVHACRLAKPEWFAYQLALMNPIPILCRNQKECEAKTRLCAVTGNETHSKTSSMVGDLTYFSHAEQSMLIATQGGLACAFSVLQVAPADGEDESDGDSPAANIADAINVDKPDEDVSPSVGKGVFIFLRVTTWEEDPEVVLDTGYSSTWFAGDPETQEMMQHYENGHWIVQDYRLRHGDKPDQREQYRHGRSEPVLLPDLNMTILRKLLELWQRYRVYSAKPGPGTTFVIDTSRLFGEVQLTTGPSDMALVQVFDVLFGNPEALIDMRVQMALQASDNAANKAHNNLLVFKASKAMAAPDMLHLTELRQKLADHTSKADKMAEMFGFGLAGSSGPDEDADKSGDGDSDGRAVTTAQGGSSADTSDTSVVEGDKDGDDINDEDDDDAQTAFYVDEDDSEVDLFADSGDE
ncbi:hypothetical protein Q5752_002565 [Cryptotrichosporon argae]